MQVAFYSRIVHFYFFFYTSLVMESFLNICVNCIQVYNLSSICDPVLSPLGFNVGRFKHWILLFS